MKHFDPNKKYLAWDGEIITGAKRISTGWTGKSKSGSTYYWYDEFPDKQPTEIEITFEPGKSYRTRGMGTATVDRVTEAGAIHGACAKHPLVYWHKSGLLHPPGHSVYDLLPGAIEDEPTPLTIDRDTINERRKRALHEPNYVVTETGIKCDGGEATTTDLRHIHNRLNWQRERIEELSAKLADAMDSGKAQTTDLFRQLRGVRERAHNEEHEGQQRDKLLTDLAKDRREHEARLDRHETNLVNHGERLTNLQDRITALETVQADHTKQVGTLQDVSIKLVGHAAKSGFHRHDEPGKRTIKGGWVNVYRYKHGPRLHISPVIFKTREECECEGSENRIACIQIPDITEGEGL